MVKVNPSVSILPHQFTWHAIRRAVEHLKSSRLQGVLNHARYLYYSYRYAIFSPLLTIIITNTINHLRMMNQPKGDSFERPRVCVVHSKIDILSFPYAIGSRIISPKQIIEFKVGTSFSPCPILSV